MMIVQRLDGVTKLSPRRLKRHLRVAFLLLYATSFPTVVLAEIHFLFLE